MKLKTLNQKFFSVCKVTDHSLVNLEVEYMFLGRTWDFHFRGFYL